MRLRLPRGGCGALPEQVHDLLQGNVAGEAGGPWRRAPAHLVLAADAQVLEEGQHDNALAVEARLLLARPLPHG